MGAYNVTDSDRWVWGDRLRALEVDPQHSVDRVSGQAPRIDGPGDVRLGPYQAVWLTGA